MAEEGLIDLNRGGGIHANGFVSVEQRWREKGAARRWEGAMVWGGRDGSKEGLLPCDPIARSSPAMAPSVAEWGAWEGCR
jgi:hypothetical protein